MPSLLSDVQSPARGVASRRIASDLRKALVGGQYRIGDRLPPRRELMRQANVSYSVIHRALELLAAEGLIEQRQGAGTFVTRTPHTPQADSATPRFIGVLPPLWDERLVALPEVMRGIGKEASLRGFRIEFIHHHGNEAARFEFVDQLIDRHLDGLIWLFPSPGHETAVGRLIDRRLPVAIIGQRFSNLPVPTLQDDLLQTASKIAQALVGAGKHRPLLLTGPLVDPLTIDQFTALRHTFESAGIEIEAHRLYPLEDPLLLYPIDSAEDLQKMWPSNGPRITRLKDWIANHSDFDSIITFYQDPLWAVSDLAKADASSIASALIVSMDVIAKEAEEAAAPAEILAFEWPLEQIGIDCVKAVAEQIPV